MISVVFFNFKLSFREFQKTWPVFISNEDKPSQLSIPRFAPVSLTRDDVSAWGKTYPNNRQRSTCSYSSFRS